MFLSNLWTVCYRIWITVFSWLCFCLTSFSIHGLLLVHHPNHGNSLISYAILIWANCQLEIGDLFAFFIGKMKVYIIFRKGAAIRRGPTNGRCKSATFMSECYDLVRLTTAGHPLPLDSIAFHLFLNLIFTASSSLSRCLTVCTCRFLVFLKLSICSNWKFTLILVHRSITPRDLPWLDCTGPKEFDLPAGRSWSEYRFPWMVISSPKNRTVVFRF